MKRSEYVRRLAFHCHRNPDHPMKSDEIAADLAEEAGATWDPEEPELPKRLGFQDKGNAIIELCHLTVPDDDESGSRYAQGFEYREAAARYNAVELFCSTEVHGDPVVRDLHAAEADLLKQLIRREREKLQ